MIVIGIFFVSSMLLVMPSNSAIQFNSIDNANESTAYIQTHFSKYLDNLPSDIPPPWFTFFYTLIMLSLNVRILIVTPLAITPTGEYWGNFSILCPSATRSSRVLDGKRSSNPKRPG